MKNYKATASMAIVYLLIAVVIGLINECHAQEKLGIGAGATIAKIEGIDAGVGFYASLNTTGKLKDWIGYTGTLQFSNYHFKIEDIATNYYSIDPAFFFQLYPAASFSVLAGASAILLLDAKVDGEDFDTAKDGGLYFTSGASFDVNEKITILGRYNIPITTGFDYTVSIGAVYKF